MADNFPILDEPPWHLTRDVPDDIDEAITAEFEPLRVRLRAVIHELPKSPVSMIAALFALANLASYVIDQAEQEQDRLAVRLVDRLELEESFSAEFWCTLTELRRARGQWQ